MSHKLKIRTKDRVIVISGRDKGRIGEVLKVFFKKQRVIVRGVNIVKRHQRMTHPSQQAGIISKEAPIAISNVSHIDPKTNRPTRIGFKILEDGRKVRYAKRSNELIDL